MVSVCGSSISSERQLFLLCASLSFCIKNILVISESTQQERLVLVQLLLLLLFLGVFFLDFWCTSVRYVWIISDKEISTHQ